MVDFRLVVSDPKSGRAYNVDASGAAAGAIVGKHIGDELDAGSIGLAGYRIKITGDPTGPERLQKSAFPGRGAGTSFSQAVSASTQRWTGNAGKDRWTNRDHRRFRAGQCFRNHVRRENP